MFFPFIEILGLQVYFYSPPFNRFCSREIYFSPTRKTRSICVIFLKNGKWCWASIQKSPVLRMMENCWVYPWPVSRELLPNTPKLLSGLMSTQCCQTFRHFEGSQNLDFALWHLRIVRCLLYVYMYIWNPNKTDKETVSPWFLLLVEAVIPALRNWVMAKLEADTDFWFSLK